MEYTPGPWRQSKNMLSEIFAGAEYIAHTIQLPPGRVEEEIANARLIAAAPDLLESLEDLEIILSGKSYDRDEQVILNRARQVIVKAIRKEV